VNAVRVLGLVMLLGGFVLGALTPWIAMRDRDIEIARKQAVKDAAESKGAELPGAVDALLTGAIEAEKAVGRPMRTFQGLALATLLIVAGGLLAFFVPLP
jgi:hypothetical protein